MSVLQASGASPLTFCASAISTCQPANSSWSCTNRAPFIDSIAAYTRAAELHPDPPGQRGQTTRLGQRRRHHQRRPRLVHHMHIQPRSTQIQPDVHHDNRPPSDMSCRPAPASVPRGRPPGFMTFIRLRSAGSVGIGYRCDAAGRNGAGGTRTAVGRPRKRVTLGWQISVAELVFGSQGAASGGADRPRWRPRHTSHRPGVRIGDQRSACWSDIATVGSLLYARGADDQ